MTAQTDQTRYLILREGSELLLLVRLRWPDVSQAISAGCPEWLDDIGLFDLPGDPSSTEVTADQAAAIATRWGASLNDETGANGTGPSLIRRMPANWSDLPPAVRRAWALDREDGRLRRRRRGGDPDRLPVPSPEIRLEDLLPDPPFVTTEAFSYPPTDHTAERWPTTGSAANANGNGNGKNGARLPIVFSRMRRETGRNGKGLP
jgi:hypothetical protein